ncbi:MAG: hypothetical protein DRH51_05565 [Candidatus Coatesbacteria bacterium]|nr:MAG: hypothetical protein DRH51_05565 [Candidatus Coatesbacteria bacterium]
MAKETNLNLVNFVLKNLGETTISTLSGISGTELLCFDKINEVIWDVLTKYKFRFMQANGSITLVQDDWDYDYPSDCLVVDPESFVYPSDGTKLDYMTPADFYRKYPKAPDDSERKTGAPRIVFEDGDYIYIYAMPDSGHAGNKVYFRYWKKPTLFTTSSNDQTSDFPEPFDRRILVAGATYKVLAYQGDEENQRYLGEYSDALGDLIKMYGDPKLRVLPVILHGGER